VKLVFERDILGDYDQEGGDNLERMIFHPYIVYVAALCVLSKLINCYLIKKGKCKKCPKTKTRDN
jgi:hypothetical protein